MELPQGHTRVCIQPIVAILVQSSVPRLIQVYRTRMLCGPQAGFQIRAFQKILAAARELDCILVMECRLIFPFTDLSTSILPIPKNATRALYIGIVSQRYFRMSEIERWSLNIFQYKSSITYRS